MSQGARPETILARITSGDARRVRAIDFGFWQVVDRRPEMWEELGSPGWESHLESLVSLVRERTRGYDDSRAYGPPLNLSRREIKARIPISRRFLESDLWDELPSAATARVALRDWDGGTSEYSSSILSSRRYDFR